MTDPAKVGLTTLLRHERGGYVVLSHPMPEDVFDRSVAVLLSLGWSYSLWDERT